MRNESRHLDGDQLLRALIDTGDLDQGLRDHLSACPQCRNGVEKLQARLDRLGRMSRNMTPSPSGAMEFPGKEDPERSRWASRAWRPVAGAAFAAVLVIAVLWGAGLFHPAPGGRESLTLQDDLDPEMVEVNSLAENPLPSLYLDLLGERDADVSDGFIRFLMPQEDNEDLSFERDARGGVIPC